MPKRPEEQGEDADLPERVPVYQHVWKSVARTRGEQQKDSLPLQPTWVSIGIKLPENGYGEIFIRYKDLYSVKHNS